MAEAQPWQPIEIAPKDGTPVVLLGYMSTDRMPGRVRRLRSCVSRWYTDYRESPAYAVGWCFSAPGISDAFEPICWSPLPDYLKAELS